VIDHANMIRARGLRGGTLRFAQNDRC